MTTTSAVGHLVALWGIVAVEGILRLRVVPLFLTLAPHEIIVVPGCWELWWLGLFAQLLLTGFAVAGHKQGIRHLFPFFYGYWACLMAVMFVAAMQGCFTDFEFKR